jgi:hypothetical protein
MRNKFSVFVRNAEGGLIEFFDLSKTDALNLVKQMKEDVFTELDVVPTFDTPYFTDSVLQQQEEEENSDL